ncbi:Gfo/Idh/MocA family oxidoreductase [Subsaximicrobium wynnwilliamsii]|uniref:Gfo/Idh/MocA family oxidoreductase n=1 Tax=Subsaximicrobium wynnwilliamsii TaxID=291179 RepID=A0A5C6ZDN8_9FLAO|nr:Gfo/Idh/MocA family oxidoreductase [Subsaximicrobium wynnwilliamsii]TXD81317.1 Gfo/Idh/MocA family oxidoreductase [Subsaximicrobium wynnwilliamsii]TXD87314.1 Gfo/Idh/MocA family oxidoreductase [Subsaximicrobium wynnwilliamsii]TXE00919.1 Gfo/Idh/MocA family oxidoreductase [Subsaximicrobium wynnwilliamsii]
MKTINWGIIGLGKIAHKFATDLKSVEAVKLQAVASRSAEKAAAFAKEFGAEKAYGSYEALVADTAVDAIYIATPHSFHKEHALLGLQNGKAVLCEKPLAMNLKDVETMIAVAKANNTLLMEALWTYFLPHYQYALKELSNETFGKIIKMEADFGFKPQIDMDSRVFKKSVGGGSLLDIGIYPIFAALSALGMPKDISAEATFFENGADSSTQMVFQYENDVEAHLRCSLLEETKTEAIFYCEKGIIKINSRFQEPTTVTLISEEKEETIDFGYTTNGYNFETHHFNTLLRQHKTESDVMSFDFSKKLMRLLDAVRSQIGLSY